MKVPSRASENAVTINDAFQTFNIPALLDLDRVQNAVVISHGISDAFSTGSQAQYPPQPRLAADQRAPSAIPIVRNVHAMSATRVERIQLASSRRVISAPIANANGIERNT